MGSSAPEGEISPIPAHLAHVPAKCLAGLAKANADQPLAQLQGNAEPILQRIRDGESARQVAVSLGISHNALYGFLLRNAPEAWMELSAGRCLARLEDAETLLDSAEDQIAVSKARESARLAQWSLERASRKLYGENKADAGGVTVQVLIVRDGETQSIVQGSSA